MTAALNLSLILLVVVVIAAVIATTIYLVKFLMELCLLTKNLNDTTDIVKKELNPLLSELTEAFHNVYIVAKDAGKQISTIKKVISTILGFVSVFAGKFKFLSGSFMKGFMSAFNLFRRK